MGRSQPPRRFPAARQGRASRPAGAAASNSVPVPSRAVSPSTQAHMLRYCRRSTSTSPKRWYMTHGTSTAASPCSLRTRIGEPPAEVDPRHEHRYDAEPVPGPRPGPSATRSGIRRSRIDRSRWARRPGASPIQPSRSSRCGQSVGTLEVVAAHAPEDVVVELVTIGLEHSNEPASGPGWSSHDPGDHHRREAGPASPVTSTYRKPWNVNRGSHPGRPDRPSGCSCRSRAPSAAAGRGVRRP